LGFPAQVRLIHEYFEQKNWVDAFKVKEILIKLFTFSFHGKDFSLSISQKKLACFIFFHESYRGGEKSG
jgi:hypothetical protein